MASAQVLTAEEARWAERRHWYVETPIGMIFAMGVALALIVGGLHAEPDAIRRLQQAALILDRMMAQNLAVPDRSVVIAPPPPVPPPPAGERPSS